MRKKLLASIIMMALAVSMLAPSVVSADTYVKSGFACRNGNNVYFSFAATKTKKATPIYKFDVRTGRRTKINLKNASGLSEFKNLNVYGKYIYCSAKTLTCTYVCKINTKTGSLKKLVRGTKPTLVNGKIVYESMKSQKIKDNLTVTYYPSGADYAMETDGTKNKPVNHVGINAETTVRNNKIAYGKYYFYISSDGKRIYRKNGAKQKLICKARKITGFRVLNGYLVVKTTKNGRNYAYCVKNNGSKSMKMLRW